jgi:hypothetical protein
VGYPGIAVIGSNGMQGFDRPTDISGFAGVSRMGRAGEAMGRGEALCLAAGI